MKDKLIVGCSFTLCPFSKALINQGPTITLRDVGPSFMKAK